jgi:hypothetical protein
MFSNTMRHNQWAFYHWCPGCQRMHGLPKQGWKFNGDAKSPSFTPSFLHRYTRDDGPDVRCHYVVTEGALHYEPDCTHKLAGQVVPMPDVPHHEAERLGL